MQRHSRLTIEICAFLKEQPRRVDREYALRCMVRAVHAACGTDALGWMPSELLPAALTAIRGLRKAGV